MEHEKNTPDLSHWKQVMEFTIEQAALLVAGIDPFDVETISEAKRQRLPQWKKAAAHSHAIVSAIRQGIINPVLCQSAEEDHNGNLYVEVIKPTNRNQDISIGHTVITRGSLENWIFAENVQYVGKKQQRLEPSLQPVETVMTTEAMPQLLSLPYQGHISEGLEFIEDVIKEFWLTYDPEDPNTAPTKEEVTTHLKSRGASGRMADAVDMTLRPFVMRTAHLKNRKLPTREDE